MAKRKLNRVERLRSIHKSLGYKAAFRYARRVGISAEALIFVMGLKWA